MLDTSDLKRQLKKTATSKEMWRSLASRSVHATVTLLTVTVQKAMAEVVLSSLSSRYRYFPKIDYSLFAFLVSLINMIEIYESVHCLPS